MSLHFSGVFSGIDSDALIKSMMDVYSVPLQRLQTKKTNWQAKAQAVSDLKSRMGNLRDLVADLSDMANLRHVSGTSSDSKVVGVMVSQGAGQGTYALEINQLASAEKEVHKGVDALDTALGGGNFVYTYNGTTRTLQLSAEKTIQDLRDRINADAGNPGITASILAYDDGLGGVYHLVLTGQDTGVANTITIEAATTLAEFGSGNWTQTQAAQDAQIRVDGYPDGSWIQKASNTLTDLIPNVTLNLYAPGTATVTLSRNDTPLKTDLSNLVAIYNGIVDKMSSYTGYNPETKVAGILQGDSTLNGVLSQVRAALTGAVAGFTSPQDTFTLVSDIGLEIDRDGHLALDDSKLTAALNEDYLGVLKLIGAMALGGTDSADLQFDSALNSTQAGAYDVEVDYDATGAITDARIRLQGEATWRSLSVDDLTLSGQLGNPEQGLQLTVLAGGISETISYQVRVQRGFAGAADARLDDIMDVNDGAYTTKKSQIDSAIDLLNKQIDRQQSRLDQIEQRMKEKYARLETTLAQIEGQNSAFQSLFEMLSSNSATINKNNQSG